MNIYPLIFQLTMSKAISYGGLVLINYPLIFEQICWDLVEQMSDDTYSFESYDPTRERIVFQSLRIFQGRAVNFSVVLRILKVLNLN